MNLLSKFSPKKKDQSPSEHFIALQIGTHHSKAAIWIQKNEEIEIETVVNGMTPEEVVRKATEKYQVSQVLFGLPDDYVSDDKIDDERLPQLKRIAETFSLAPLGFVVVSEAIAHLLESEQGSPQTAIFVSVTQVKLAFSLFRVGKLTKTYQTPRTDNLIHDFEKGLSQFTEEEVLPSKIILDNEDASLKNIKEELLNYGWQNNDKFLHVPKIELLPWEYSIEAVVQAGVSEMGEAPVFSEDQPESKVQEQPSISGVTKTTASALGFSAATEESMTINQPTAHTTVEEVQNVPQPIVQTEETADQEGASVKSKFPKISMPKIPSLPRPSNISLPGPHGLIPAAIVGIVLIVGFAVLAYSYPKTKITLLAKPDVIEDEITISLNTNADDINISEGEIPGKVHSATVSSEKTSDTTGTKTIGEKASGKITLYNKDTSEKSFEAGTVLGTSNVSFTLNEDVKVASASDTGESLEYGKVSTTVTAVKIGPQGNIDSGKEMSIDDVSKNSAMAKSDEQFSGGTEREINVVSEDDHDGLVLGATDELTDQAQDQLKTIISSDEKFLDESIAENVVEKSFNADVGEEVDTVTLDLVLEISQTSYKVDDLDRFLEGYMKEQIKDGYMLDSEKSFFRVIETEEDEDGNVTFTANYHAFLVPDVTLDGFKEKLTGASVSELESIVSDLTDQNIVGYEITNKRSLPFISSWLPFSANNIEIEVEVYE